MPLHCPHRSTPTSPRGWPRERAPSSPPRSRPLVARLTRQSRRSPPPPPSCRCTVRRPSGSTGFLLSLTRTAGPCGSRVPRPGRKLQECRGEVGEVQPSEAEPGGAHCGLAGRLASHWLSRTAASPLRWLSAAQPCPEQSREGHNVALTDGPEGSREGLNEGRAAPARPRPGNRCAGGTPGVGPPPDNVRPGPAGLRAGNEAHESVRSGLERCGARKVVYPSNPTCGVLAASRRWRSNGVLRAPRGAGGVRPAQRSLARGSVSRWPAAAPARACGGIFEPVRASGCERPLRSAC